MTRINLDMAVLRTLATAQQLGSFNRAAGQIGRSKSAVSQQIRKLEEQVGEPLFRKQGRDLVLTDAGEVVLAYARRILDLNDEAVAALRGRAIEGVVRFGLPADFAEAWLPSALGRFKRAHPAVRIEAVVDRNRRLLERLDKAELDLVLALGNLARDDAESVAHLPLVWIGPSSMQPIWTPGEPIPLAMVEPPCFFRQGAITALDRAGVPWCIAFTSPSLHGLWAAVEAGLGVTLRTAVGLPPGVRVLDDALALPPAPGPALALCLHDGGRPLGPALYRLRSIIFETLDENLPRTSPPQNERGPIVKDLTLPRSCKLKVFVQARSDWTFDGIDPSAEMLKLPEQTLGPLASRARPHQGHIDGARQGPFDAATCLLTLHFMAVEERRHTAIEVQRRLKPSAPYVIAHLSFPQGEGERALSLSRHAAFLIASGLDPDKAAKRSRGD